MVPIANLTLHPDNPNQGDIGNLVDMMRQNGFYGSVVANLTTGHVIVGNHRCQAAALAGIAVIPVDWIEVDAATELRIMIEDNRSRDRAAYDEPKLADLLTRMANTQGLDGTGYDGDDLDDLIRRVNAKATTDTSFLNQYTQGVTPREFGHEEDSTTRTEPINDGRNDYVKLVFDLHVDTRNAIVRRLNECKRENELDTNAEALACLLEVPTC